MFNNVDEVSILSVQVESLKRMMDNLNYSNRYVQNIICDYCGGEHAYSECVIPVNFLKGRFVIFNVVRKFRVDFKNFENIFVVDKLFET